MRNRSQLVLTSLLLLTLGFSVTSCARKAKQTPPTQTTAPTPAPTPPPVPAPPPTPEPTTPAPTAFTASDLQPAFFALDSYVLDDAARGALDSDAKMLRDHADLKVVIEGHCDERGTDEYNQALGEKRAQAARDYLVNAGIQTARLSIISYGKERPFDPGHDEAAWSKNRRAHFTQK